MGNLGAATLVACVGGGRVNLQNLGVDRPREGSHSATTSSNVINESIIHGGFAHTQGGDPILSSFVC